MNRTDMLGKAVVIYTWLFFFYRILNTLTPVAEVFKQPVFSTVPKLLGLAGAVLLAVDLITDRTVLRSASVGWILLLLLSLSVSAAVRYPYNSFFEFTKYIVYVSVQDLLIYSAGIRMSREEQKRFLKALHTTASVIFIPALCYMFYQFVTRQHYITSEDLNQGWFEGRLFGIMNSLYGGAIVVSLLAFGTVFLLLQSRKPLQKALYASELIIFTIYLALSDCRTAYAALAAGLGLALLYHCLRTHSPENSPMIKVFIKFLIIYTTALLIMFAGIAGIRTAGSYVNAGAAESRNEMRRPEGASFSSRRLTIWNNYIEIMTDKPSHLIFGLSYNGYEKYIREHYPEAYIVSFFRNEYPYLYRKGEVYQTHNSYLMVLVVAGLPGVVAVIGFLISGARYVISLLFSGGMTSFESLLSALVLMVLTAGIFETTSIIPVNAVSGFFWMISGLLMNTKLRKEDPARTANKLR